MRLTILAALAAAVAALALVPRTAHACSCMAPPGPEEALETYDAVFVGRIHDVRTIEKTFPDEDPSSPSGSIYMNEARVAVETVWKGDLDGAATLSTGTGGGDCGYPFQASRSYLMYAAIDPETGLVGTSICSPTKPLDQADGDIAVLDAVSEPYEPPAASVDELEEWPADSTPAAMFGSSGEDGGPADAPAEEDAEEGAVPLTSSSAALVPALLGVAGLAAIALIVLGRRRRSTG